MTESTISPGPSRARLTRVAGIILVLFAIVVVLGGLAVIRSRSFPGVARAQSVERAQLLLTNGLYVQAGGTNPFSGFMVERYEAGSLKSRSTVVHGLLDGVSEGWHTNGQLQVREQFRRGVSHGLRTKWHASGQKLSEVPIVEGKLHGTFRRWHENGRLAEELPMHAGEPHGLSRSFYPSGAPKAQVNLERGKLLSQQFWPEAEPVVNRP